MLYVILNSSHQNFGHTSYAKYWKYESRKKKKEKKKKRKKEEEVVSSGFQFILKRGFSVVLTTFLTTKWSG